MTDWKPVWKRYRSRSMKTLTIKDIQNRIKEKNEWLQKSGHNSIEIKVIQGDLKDLNALLVEVKNGKKVNKNIFKIKDLKGMIAVLEGYGEAFYIETSSGERKPFDYKERLNVYRKQLSELEQY